MAQDQFHTSQICLENVALLGILLSLDKDVSLGNFFLSLFDNFFLSLSDLSQGS